MKIFVLEDIPERVDFFKKCLKDFESVFVTNYDDAVVVLESKFDAAFLDHDISSKSGKMQSSIKTGFDVVCVLSNGINADIPVLIHSWNTPGVKRMRSVLPNSICCRFSDSDAFRNTILEFVKSAESA